MQPGSYFSSPYNPNAGSPAALTQGLDPRMLAMLLQMQAMQAPPQQNPMAPPQGGPMAGPMGQGGQPGAPNPMQPPAPTNVPPGATAAPGGNPMAALQNLTPQQKAQLMMMLQGQAR